MIGRFPYLKLSNHLRQKIDYLNQTETGFVSIHYHPYHLGLIFRVAV